MGCSASFRSKANKTQSTAYTQPNIEPDSINLFPISIFPVSERACGYNFSDGSVVNGLKDRGSMMNGKLMKIDELKVFLQRCEYYYYEHDIDSAYEYLQRVNNYVFDNRDDKENKDLIDGLILGKKDLMKRIDQEYKDVISYQREILKGGWVQKSNKKGLKISTRREESTVGVLVQAVIDQPFQYLIAALIEMSLYK